MPAGQNDYALAAYSISSYIHTHTTIRKSERKTGDVHNSTNNKQKQRIGADLSLSPYSHTYCHTYYWYSITHSLFHSRLKFSANPPYRTLSFFSFRFHYMDFPDCLLLLLSTSVYLLFSFFLFLHFFTCRFRAVD